jgi:general secretion pathway protein B
MSLLLDALNKADEERKRGDGPPTIDSHHNEFDIETKRKIPRALVILIIIIVLASLFSAVYWLGKNTQPELAGASSTQSPESQEPSAPTDFVKTAETIAPSTISKGGISKDSISKNGISTNTITTKSNAIQKNTIEQDKIPDAESVATLYQQQTNDNLPAPETKTVTNQNTQAVNAPNSIKQFANLPEIQDLPNEVLNNLPSLKYTEHNYNSNGGSVVINGLVKHVNEELAQGLVIDKILEDGIILHIGNYSFKMRALNTWMNM